MKAKIVIILLFIFCGKLTSQSRSELEALRKKSLEEIEYVDKMLKNTESEKRENLGELVVIGKKLNLRERIINEYGEEISLLEYRISLNKLGVDLMEEDLENLRNEYEASILSAYKAMKGTPAVAFILSSKDFNQGYKRLKYIQQVARYRRKESEIIQQVYDEIQASMDRLQEDRKSIGDLRSKEERQKQILKEEQLRKERLVKNLSKKEKQLRIDLDEKKRVAKKIESEIAKLIEEERRKSLVTPMSNEMKLIGESFGDNKGRIPWPIDKGIITSHFGLQNHPILKNVVEDNIGIEITSSGRTIAKSVYKGQIMRVFSISGANMTIIVRHGKYLTVYQNLINVKVKPGDNVAAGQELGDVFSDTSDNNKAVLKFMVYEEKTKLNPELWLVKK